MRFLEFMHRFFAPAADEASSGDALSSLVEAARENTALKHQLLALLALAPEHRLAILRRMRGAMILSGEPEELIAAFARLADDRVAYATLRTVESLA